MNENSIGNATDCLIATSQKPLTEIYKTKAGKWRKSRRPIIMDVDYSKFPQIPDPLGIPKRP